MELAELHFLFKIQPKVSIHNKICMPSSIQFSTFGEIFKHTVGPPPQWSGVVKIDFRKTAFRGKVFLRSQGVLRGSGRNSVFLRFNVFCKENFHLGTMGFPRGNEGVVQIRIFSRFMLK